MPKPISWLKDAADIRKEVASSTYSHFRTSDIARLFRLMPRAASILMEAMPRVRYGTSYIVPAEGLAEFLDDVLRALASSKDVPALIEARRRANLYVSRRRPRFVVAKENLGNGLASLPDSVTLTRGELHVKFRTGLELAEALVILASNINGDAEWGEFCRLYEPELPELPDLPSEMEAIERACSDLLSRGSLGTPRDELADSYLDKGGALAAESFS